MLPATSLSPACQICYEDITPRRPGVFCWSPCLHAMHEDCIVPRLLASPNNQRCPNCACENPVLHSGLSRDQVQRVMRSCLNRWYPMLAEWADQDIRDLAHLRESDANDLAPYYDQRRFLLQGLELCCKYLLNIKMHTCAVQADRGAMLVIAHNILFERSLDWYIFQRCQEYFDRFRRDRIRSLILEVKPEFQERLDKLYEDTVEFTVENFLDQGDAFDRLSWFEVRALICDDFAQNGLDQLIIDRVSERLEVLRAHLAREREIVAEYVLEMYFDQLVVHNFQLEVWRKIAQRRRV